MSFRGDNPMRGHAVLSDDGTPNVLYQAERWTELAQMKASISELHAQVQELRRQIIELQS